VPITGACDDGDACTQGDACQGAVWSDDQKRLLVQCSVERDIRVYDFDGKTLTERPEAALQMVSRPGAMVTNRTR
jgi:hypothetical protein